MRSTTRLLLALLAAATLFSPCLLAGGSPAYTNSGDYSALDNACCVIATGESSTELGFQVIGYAQTLETHGSTVKACVIGIVIEKNAKSPAPTVTNPPADGGESQIKAANPMGDSVGYVQVGPTAFNFNASEWTPPSGLIPADEHPDAASTSWKLTMLAKLSNSTNTFAQGINASGTIVGSSEFSSSLPHAVLWSANGTISDLNNLDGNSSLTLMSANAINDSGQIVGQALGTSFDAFLLDHGTATDLGNLPGDSSGQANAINNSGQIVGLSTNTTNGHCISLISVFYENASFCHF